MNDNELKTILAKMLPETVEWNGKELLWKNQKTGFWYGNAGRVLDTELLHLASLVEKKIILQPNAGYARAEYHKYNTALETLFEGKSPSHYATWQQRVTALAQVKGVTL